MKFFTREWATGELADHEFESTADRYSDYLAGLDLPSDVLNLANVDLHDGLVLGVQEGTSQLTIRFVTGDLQRGYFTTTITYENPLAGDATVTLLQSAARNAHFEMLEHEVDQLDSKFIHRMLFSSYEEATIAFSSASVSQFPRQGRTPNAGTAV